MVLFNSFLLLCVCFFRRGMTTLRSGNLRVSRISLSSGNKMWSSVRGNYGEGGAFTTKAIIVGTASRLMTESGVFPGILSGGLHAITGPDHLAAILPASVGQTFLGGIKIGAAWGLGHGITASFFGVLAYSLKGRMINNVGFLDRLSNLAEAVVGISLVAIGLIGVKESVFVDKRDLMEPDNEDGSIYYSPPPGII